MSALIGEPFAWSGDERSGIKDVGFGVWGFEIDGRFLGS
jgi:hypothetical protein